MMKEIEYGLGYYVGLYVFHTSLPTLSTDMIKSNRVIYVSASEGDKQRELENIWHKNYVEGNTDDEYWVLLTKHRNQLAEKYLPNSLECYVPKINCNDKFNKPKFIEGFRDCLWNTDLCWYNITTNEDIVIDWDSEKYFTKITLSLKLIK